MATKQPKTQSAKTADTKKRTTAARDRVIAVAKGNKLDGFVTFIREKGVVGLAVGLAIGTAATGVVTQVVGAIITPTIVLLIGANGLASLNTTVNIAGRSATYAFGDLLDALLKFIAVAAVIYFVVMGLKLDRLDKKKDA